MTVSVSQPGAFRAFFTYKLMRYEVIEHVWLLGGFLFARDMASEPILQYIGDIGRKLTEELAEAQHEIGLLFTPKENIAHLNEEFADVLETIAHYKREFGSEEYASRRHGRHANLLQIEEKLAFLEGIVRTAPSLPPVLAERFLNRIVADLMKIMTHLCNAPGGYTTWQAVSQAGADKRATKGPLTRVRVEVVLLPATDKAWCARFAKNHPEVDPAPYIYARQLAFTPQQLAVTLG
ncbi:MAG: hypothetical protein DI628_04950 [Blastochloris viridis]|uniref:Uncharacterized protein n=1 Tax=Blastochloris viridis TaxID=1079 RepID=A0A6N4RDB1_BLAVI|nr:MAG: hypothetical protein DI628_04950 [Blastochloris viridis]